jgi:hypothetical protein
MLLCGKNATLIWFQLTNKIMMIPEKYFLLEIILKLLDFLESSSKNPKLPKLFTNKSNEVKNYVQNHLPKKPSLKSAKNIHKISSMQKIKFHSFYEQFSDHHKYIIYMQYEACSFEEC